MSSIDKPMKISLAEIHELYVKDWKHRAESLEREVKELKEHIGESSINNVVMNKLIPVLGSQDRKAIFDMFLKFKESSRPTERNCNCFNNAIGKFDSIEYQDGQPGVEPFNPETFRHTCDDYDDYGYVWDWSSMQWDLPHEQNCSDYQNGYDCMHMEGEGDWDFFDQLEEDTNHKYEIVYASLTDGKGLIGIETNTYPDIIITAEPVEFFNYIADMYPMTWIKWNLGNDNPLNDFLEISYKDTPQYNINNELEATA